MLTTYGAMIKNDIIERFNQAVADPENINTSGGINWNYVDADVHIAMSVIYSSDYLNDCMEVLVDNYFGKAA
jgi:hypothetical protein